MTNKLLQCKCMQTAITVFFLLKMRLVFLKKNGQRQMTGERSMQGRGREGRMEEGGGGGEGGVRSEGQSQWSLELISKHDCVLLIITTRFSNLKQQTMPLILRLTSS